MKWNCMYDIVDRNETKNSLLVTKYLFGICIDKKLTKLAATIFFVWFCQKPSQILDLKLRCFDHDDKSAQIYIRTHMPLSEQLSRKTREKLDNIEI